MCKTGWYEVVQMASCPLDPQLICRLPGADPNLYVVNRSKDSFRHGLSFWQEKDDCAARENKPVLIWSSTVQNAFTFYPSLFIFIFESVIMSVFCSSGHGYNYLSVL